MLEEQTTTCAGVVEQLDILNKTIDNGIATIVLFLIAATAVYIVIKW